MAAILPPMIPMSANTRPLGVTAWAPFSSRSKGVDMMCDPEKKVDHTLAD
jgi:hypothetical protein